MAITPTPKVIPTQIAVCFRYFVAVTPSDTTNDPNGPFLTLYVGGAGNVSVYDLSGNNVVFSGVPAGTFLPINVLAVGVTLTTATLIIGLK